MDAHEWLSSTDPWRMLTFLRESGRLSERKARLCAAACCRRIWHFLPCDRCREAVRRAELHADGLVGEWEREEAIRQALDAFIPLGAAADALSCGTWTALDGLPTDDERNRYEGVYRRAYRGALDSASDANEAWEASQAALAAYRVLVDGADACCQALLHAARTVAHGCSYTAGTAAVPPDTLHARQHPWCYAKPEVAYTPPAPHELARQCDIVADIFGNPFQQLPAIEPSVLRWNGGLVVQLARAAYDERSLPEGTLDPALLAILADALEEAGLENEEILAHLRQQGQVHYRGYWPLDLILGKE